MLASVSYLARLSDHVPALPAHAEMAVGMLNYVYERSEHFLVLELLRLLLMQLASYECSSIFSAETAPTKCFGRLAKSAEGFYTVIRFGQPTGPDAHIQISRLSMVLRPFVRRYLYDHRVCMFNWLQQYATNSAKRSFSPESMRTLRRVTRMMWICPRSEPGIQFAVTEPATAASR